MATKIETDLTPEELGAFFKRVAQARGGVTGPVIQAICAEFGVTISKETANQYRQKDGVVGAYLQRLQANAEKSREIVETVRAGIGISDANAVRLQMAISDKLDAIEATAVSAEEIELLASSNEKLRTGDRNAKRLEADLQIAAKKLEVADARLAESEKKRAIADEQIAKLKADAVERAERARKLQETIAAAKSKGGITRETLRKIEEEAKLL